MNKEPLIPDKLRPYEKFIRYGVENLTESELLAVILRCGTKNMNAETLSAHILSLASGGRNSLIGLHHISLEQLLAIKGIGRVKAIQIKCVMEFCRRVASANAYENLTFNRSDTVASYYMESMRHRSRECVILICLDAKGHLLKEMELSKGTVKASLLSPRDVFLEALKAEAVHILLMHNHPSGDPTPSRADLAITKTIAEFGEKLDIPLIHHIIIGDNKYISFKEQGYL